MDCQILLRDIPFDVKNRQRLSKSAQDPGKAVE
jgi:hypothetical protein